MKQLKERLQVYGPDMLSTAELLAYLLAANSGRTVSEPLLAACRLLDTYSIRELVNANMVDLGSVGLSKMQMQRLRVVCVLAQRLNQMDPREYPCICAPSDAVSILRPLLMHLDHEEFWILVLDTKHRVLSTKRAYVGTVNTSVLRAAEVFRLAIGHNSPAIIVAHNHPSGDPASSPEDVVTTEQLVQAGKLLDIEVVDHLIIGNPGYTSLRERMHW